MGGHKVETMGRRKSLHARVHAGIPFLAFALLAGALHNAPAGAQTAPDPLELMKQLNGVTLDPSKVYVIRGCHLARSRMTLYLNRGFVAFMKPVDGRITGAVFWGEGEVLMVPPDGPEKRNLAHFTHTPILEENIDSAYLRFSDQTAEELLEASRPPDPDDIEQPNPFTTEWVAVAQPPNLETSVRILKDLVGDHTHPYFFARVRGENLGVFDLEDDERQAEPFTVSARRKVGPQEFEDVWSAFPTADSNDAAVDPLRGRPKALSYTLDVRIQPDHSLEGRAEIQLESQSAKDRVITFALSRWLDVSSVEDEHGTNIPVIGGQPSDPAHAEPRPYNRVDIVLPHPHPPGERFRLIWHYHGNVIADEGNGVLFVGARGSWYPHIDIGFPSQYSMTFRYPRKLVLVATGERVEEKTTDEWTESRWQSDGVFRVSGFNLGPYITAQRHAGKTEVLVYATPEAESALAKRHDSVDTGPLVIQSPTLKVLPPSQTNTLPLIPSESIGSVADVASRAVHYYSTLFGPYPYPRLSISQAPGGFGQGWPELVYLPTLSFLPESERWELGTVRGGGDPLGPQMIAHEIAHQWWGNLLGWRTYHDQWLSEGLATYAAAMFIAQGKDGRRQLNNLLHSYKEALLAKTSEGATVESGGPIWLGYRLSSSLDPQGYSNIVYKKACWVLHMLRAVLTDPATGSDARFFRMLRDFATHYQGQSVTTEDFVQFTAKYMTSQSDLDHNHRLDWFFDEWVYDTGIPNYTLKTDVRPLPDGRFAVQGSIEQSGVPGEFEMPVRLQADYLRERRVTLGQVVVGASGAQFKFTVPRKPDRVFIDEENLLARVH
jgi:hypothetical protein